MSLLVELKSFKQIFLSIPGIGLILLYIKIPPGQSRGLYEGIILAVCCLFIIVLLLNKGKIIRLKTSKLSLYIIGLLCVFLFFLFLYITLLDNQTIKSAQNPQFGEIFFPFWSNEALSNIVNNICQGSKEKAIDEFLGEVQIYIKQEPFYYNISIIALFLILLLSFLSLITAYYISLLKIISKKPSVTI